MFGLIGRVVKRARGQSESLKFLESVFTPVLARMPPPPIPYWSDPYVLGAIYGASGMMVHLASNGSLSTMDKGEVIGDVVKQVTFGSGVESLASLIRSKHPDFELAAQRSARLAKMYWEKRLEPIRPDMEAAVKSAQQFRELNEGLGLKLDGGQEIIAALTAEWLVEPMRERLLNMSSSIAGRKG